MRHRPPRLFTGFSSCSSPPFPRYQLTCWWSTALLASVGRGRWQTVCSPRALLISRSVVRSVGCIRSLTHAQHADARSLPPIQPINPSQCLRPTSAICIRRRPRPTDANFRLNKLSWVLGIPILRLDSFEVGNFYVGKKFSSVQKFGEGQFSSAPLPRRIW